MNSRMMATASVAASLMVVLGSAGAAHAVKDIGVKSQTCSGGYFGKLSVYQRGSGNMFAPGNDDSAPKWHSSSSTYRWIYDSESTGTGGGSWRVVANDTYMTSTPGCSNFG